MKKLMLALALVLSISMLSGCQKTQNQTSSEQPSGEISGPIDSVGPAKDAADVFAVYNRETGAAIRIGDTMEQTDTVTGGKKLDIVIFEDDVERTNFADAEGLFLDNLDGEVVAWYFVDEAWEVGTGARIGMTKEEIKALYSAYPHLHESTENEFLIAFDEDQQPIPYVDDAYYMLDFTFNDQDIVDYIAMHSNIAHEKLMDKLNGQLSDPSTEEEPAQSAALQAA